MKFDRHDIIEAWFLYFCHFHEGQSSQKYKRLCKMLKYFRPISNLSVESLSENGKMIYNHLAGN